MKKQNKNSFIFTYWDGEKERRIDAFKMALTLEEKFGLDSALNDKITKKDVAVLRELFSLKEWSEETNLGVTDGELLQILIDFNELIEKKSVVKDGNQTSPPPMELPSLRSPSIPSARCG